MNLACCRCCPSSGGQFILKSSFSRETEGVQVFPSSASGVGTWERPSSSHFGARPGSDPTPSPGHSPIGSGPTGSLGHRRIGGFVVQLVNACCLLTPVMFHCHWCQGRTSCTYDVTMTLGSAKGWILEEDRGGSTWFTEIKESLRPLWYKEGLFFFGPPVHHAEVHKKNHIYILSMDKI